MQSFDYNAYENKHLNNKIGMKIKKKEEKNDQIDKHCQNVEFWNHLEVGARKSFGTFPGLTHLLPVRLSRS